MWNSSRGLLVAMLVTAATVFAAGALSAQELKCEPGKLAQKYPDLVGKTIRIGADPQTRPFVFRDPKNFDSVIGFDADLARSVFDCAGIQYEFFLGGWSGLVPAVMAGQIDVMWDALYYLPERAKRADFVVYMQAGVGAVVPLGNPRHLKTIEDLCGLKVSALLGTVEEATLKKQSEKCKADGKPGIDIEISPDSAAALRLLLSQRVDVFFIDLGLALGVTKERPNDVTFAFRHLTGLKQAVGVEKGRESLLQAIYDGLRIAQANGTQRALSQKYDIDPELQLPPEIRRE